MLPSCFTFHHALAALGGVGFALALPTVSTGQEEKDDDSGLPSDEEFEGEPRLGDAGETAEEILSVARRSLAPVDVDLTGVLRPKGFTFRKVPFKLTMFENSLRFRFHKDDKSRNPFDQTITLELKGNRYQMFETVDGEKKELPLERYGEHVRGTDVTYEDIALRFLYWPDAKRLPDEKLGRKRETCVIECENPIKDPAKSGPYRRVVAWIHKLSGALLQIEGYGDDGVLVKQFLVRDIQRAGNGEWVLKEVRVSTHDPKSGKHESETIMEIDDPKDRKR